MMIDYDNICRISVQKCSGVSPFVGKLCVKVSHLLCVHNKMSLNA